MIIIRNMCILIHKAEVNNIKSQASALYSNFMTDKLTAYAQ